MVRPLLSKTGQQGGLPFVPIFEYDQEQRKATRAQQEHGPERQRQGRAAQRAGGQQAPWPGQQNHEKKAAGREIGEPGQNTQQVVGKEGKEKRQKEKHIPLAANDVQIPAEMV